MSSTPLSRTCQNCANSKVRCVRNSDGRSACNRCHRLGKECVYRQARRRFNGFQKDQRIEALESRVIELMAAGTATSVNPNVSSSASARRAPRSEISEMSESESSDVPGHDVIDGGLLTMDTAESLLSVFKTTTTEHMPFVVIPLHVTAEQLRREKPFLFLAVIASASYADMPLQRVLGKAVKEAIATRMILNGEVSFDLLQGLLVYLSWCHYFTRPRRYGQFLQLAVSLIIELRLDRPPRTKTWKTPIRFKFEHRHENETSFIRPSWSRDEQRAIAGCYYLSSTIAVLLQKQSTFPHTAHVEECCRSLHDNPEYPSDKHILDVVQLQLIAEKIDRLSLRHGMELDHPGSASELYVTNLKSELEAFRDRLPFSLNESPLLAMQFHTTQLCLYQVSMLDSAGHGCKATQSGPSASWRNEMLCAGLIAAKSLFNVYLALPFGAEMALNNTEWVQMGFALLVAAKQVIAAIVAGRTSPEMAGFLRRHFSLSATLTQMRRRVGALTTSQVDANGDRDVFFDFEGRVARLQSWFDEKVERKEPAQSEHTPSSLNEPGAIDDGSRPGDEGVLQRFDMPADAQGLFVDWPNAALPPETVNADEYQLTQEILSSVSIEQMMDDWMQSL